MDVRTIDRWRATETLLCQAVKAGKEALDGLLRYADQAKTRAWATSGGVQFPWLVQLLRGSGRNLLGPADVVKRGGGPRGRAR